MEYVHGRNLEQYAVEEPVTPRRAAELVAKLAGALPGPIPTPIPSPTHAAPPHGGITLWVNEPKSTFRRGLRLNQPGAVPVKSGDEVRVEAGLDRPAYLYLFWLGADGKVAPLYPWKELKWTERPLQEEKVERVDVPEIVDKTMTLDPSAPGLETLVLLAREDSPLPRDADAALAQDLDGLTTTQLPDWMNEAVWIENGRQFGLDDKAKERAAPGRKTRKSDDPVLRIRRLLQEKVQPLGAYHQAVIVPNQGGT
jgi:hypothetical protein